MHQKFIHFPRHSSAGESNFHTVEYRIIDNTSQWLNFQAGSTLWSRQLHFVIVLQSLGPSCFPIYRNEVSFVQSRARVRENDVVRESSSLKKVWTFSHLWNGSFLSFFWCSESELPVKPVNLLLPSKQFFTVDRAASLLMSTRVYPITESSVLLACPLLLLLWKARVSPEERGRESWISHVWEFTYCEIEIAAARGAEREAEFSEEGRRREILNPKFQVGTLLSDAVLFHDSSSIPPYLLWPADRHS